MSRIRSALEDRLRSPDLSVDEAIYCAVTLLDLREDHVKVAGEYLGGRGAMLGRSLKHCFDVDVTASIEKGSKNLALRTACTRSTEEYVPQLCDAVEGFAKLQERCAATSDATSNVASSFDTMLTEFISTRVRALCDQVSALVERQRVPTRVLVACVHSVRDAVRRLYTMHPSLLTKIFMEFLASTASNAMKRLFADATSALVADLRSLHGECKRLQESNDSGLDDVLEQIVKTEESMIMHGFTALSDCQPLMSLLGSDHSAGHELVRGLQEQLITFFLAFVETCHAYIVGCGSQKLRGVGGGATSTGSSDSPADNSSPTQMPQVLPQVVLSELDAVGDLVWNGLFALALVRIGRHLEVKAIGKVWLVAKDLFSSSDASAELLPSAPLIKATRQAAQGVITHYAVSSGQRLAHFFRNSVQSRNWMTVREPREPRLVVDMVLKEVHAFDAQLARILGDPRKPRGQEGRRHLSQRKSAMELEMERLWAKKLQVFAPIPFNRNGAIVGILRIAFKALYEYMREETFAKFGLQQIQVDCAFMAEIVRDFVEPEDANVLDSLLDEAVTSATARCAEPVLMDTVMVEAVCDEKKRAFKFE
jgi:hypothetical protein